MRCAVKVRGESHHVQANHGERVGGIAGATKTRCIKGDMPFCVPKFQRFERNELARLNVEVVGKFVWDFSASRELNCSKRLLVAC